VAAAAALAPIVRTTQRTTLASIQLIDRNGMIVLGHEAGGSYAQLPELSAALRGRIGTMLRRNGAYSQRYSFEWLSRASSLRIHHARPIIVGGRVAGVLLLSRSPRALFRGLYEDRGKIILGVVLIFLALLVLTGLLSRGIARPIEALARATRGVAAGTGTVPDTPVTAAWRSGPVREFRSMTARSTAVPLPAGFRRLGQPRVQDAPGGHRRHHRAVRGPWRPHDGCRARALPRQHEGRCRPGSRQCVTRLLDLARADMASPFPTRRSRSHWRWCEQVADAFNTPDLHVSIAPRRVADPGRHACLDIEVVLGTLLTNARQAGADSVSVDLVSVRGCA
jgi:hypothetical protein